MLSEQFETFDFGNSILIDNRDDPVAKYDWLKSSDRDGQMGALSYTNRRTLILSPGLYTTSDCWAVDTEHVDIKCSTPDPADTVVTCSDNSKAVMKQTAADVQMSGFTVRNTSTSEIPAVSADGGTSDVTRGLIIENEERNEGATISGTSLTKAASDLGVKVVDSCFGFRPDEVFVWDLDGGVTAGWYDIVSVTDDDTVVLASAPGDSAGDVFYEICFQHSTYRNMAFYSDKHDEGAGSNGIGGIGCRGHMGGLYEHLILGNGCLRTKHRNIDDWFYDAGELYNVSIDNGQPAVDLGGGLVGIPVTGHIIRPEAYVKIANTVAYNGFYPIHSVTTDQIKIEMPFTAETFGADDLIDIVWPASHRITARYITGGHYCYGGDTMAEFAADYDYVTGEDKCFNGCTQWGAPIRNAQLRHCKARDNSFSVGGWILQSAVLEHCEGRYACFAGTKERGVAVGKFWGTGRHLKAESDVNTYDSFGAGDYASGGKTYGDDFNKTASLRGILEHCQYGIDADWKAGTRGGGRYDDFDTDEIGVKDCHPLQPTACTANTDVSVLDNGHIFTNEGAAGLITWSLPPAIRGLKFTFVRTDFAAGEDVRIDPDGTEHIFQLDGTDCGAGKWFGSDAGVDAFARIVLECFKTGEWQSVEEIGTLDDEA